MPRLYSTREAVKSGAGITGAQLNTIVDRKVRAASASIEKTLRRTFIPETSTRLYRWPPLNRPGRRYIFELNHDLISLTTLKTKAQDSSPTTIAATDYFLEPQDTGPPYYRIEIDLSSSAAFEGGDTPQRSISILGRWGYSEDTEVAGTITSGLSSSSTATSMVCSDASKIDVGDTLLIETESILVTERTNAQAPSSQTLDGALTKDQSEVSITVDSGAQFGAREVILVDSERMYISSISGNVLTVIRSWDGSALAAHDDNTAVHVFRTLTIVRGQNGTTSATHADSTAISRYTPPADIFDLCNAMAIAAVHQERAGYARSIGSGDSTEEFKGVAVGDLWKQAKSLYQRVLMGAVI